MDSIPNEGAFRAEVREFAQSNCPAEIRAIVAAGGKLDREHYVAWQKALLQRGWAAPSWPVEHGGTGWNLKQRLIFEEESARAHCPPLYHHGLGHIGPVIIRFGSPEQKRRFLPRILDCTDWWCQGYSEPDAGSDLASLRMTARLDGDCYVLNGQKTWSSHAQDANMMYVLARTTQEARKQAGISLLLVPMDSPGMTVRPIRTIDGWHHVNEVFFDQVRVPVANLVGEEGRGWECAKYLLERERVPAASVARLELLWRQVDALLDERRAVDPRRDFAGLRQRLLLAEATIAAAHEMLTAATEDLIHQRALGSKPSALKLLASEVTQDLSVIAMESLGADAVLRFMPLQGGEGPHTVWIHNYLYYRSRTIAGGTSEVQRNLLAQQLFGQFQAEPLFAGMLHDAATRLAGDLADGKPRVGSDPMTELGWPAMLVAEDDGGMGCTLTDLAAVIEALSAKAVSLPVVERCGIVPAILQALGARDLLRALAEGAVRIAPLFDAAEPFGTTPLQASERVGGYTLTGTLRGVPFADGATHYLAIGRAAQAPSDMLFFIPVQALPAPQRRHVGMDGVETEDFIFDVLQVDRQACLAEGDLVAVAVDHAFNLALAASCVDMLAAQGAVVEQTIAHLNARVQFGVALSTFQVLRHRVVDMYLHYEVARGLVARLLRTDASDAASFGRHARLAKLSIGEGARFIAEAAIQLHGGMGMSQEVMAARLAQRLVASGFRYGDCMALAATLMKD